MNKFKLYEPYFFLLLVILFCMPVFLSYRFITLDGPAHLYNSNLIHQLLFDSSSIANHFFEFNRFPIPNYFYHAVATIFLTVFNDNSTEKLIAILYVFLFCYGFRSVVLAAKSPTIFSYLVFPYVYCFTFLIGFYNYSFSVAFLFWFVALLVKNQNDEKISGKNVVWFFILFTLLYFSHLMLFLLAFVLTISFIIIKTIEKKHFNKQQLKIIAPALVYILFACCFVFKHHDHEQKQYLSFLELKNWLIDARHFICRDYDKEFTWSRIINGITVLLFLFSAFWFIKKQTNKWTIKSLINQQILFLSIATGFFTLFFIAPNNLVSGGFLTVRFLMLAYLFVLLFIIFIVDKINYFVTASVISTVICSLFLLKVHIKNSKELGYDFKAYASVIEHIPQNSVVLPIDYSENWLNSNYGCYVGANKNIAVLDNYETATVHFPLSWKEKKHIPGIHMPQYATVYNACLPVHTYEKNSGIKIDYIVRWKYNHETKDSCNLYTDSIIRQYYNKIYISPEKKAELFMRKK